jgi:arylformamidase
MSDQPPIQLSPRRLPAKWSLASSHGAAYLAGVGVRTVGIDYLSIGHGDDGPAVHRALLGAQVLIVEGLNLSDVEPGAYDLVCLPLKIRDGDGAPARALKET